MPPSYVVPEPCRLPPITKLSNRIWRVMGLNPSPMTLGGTNCYILGDGSKRILLDTGEGVPEFQDLLKEALRQIQQDAKLAEPVKITTALISHWHRDHVGGIGQVRELFPDCVVRKAVSHVVPDPELEKSGRALQNGETILDAFGGLTLTVIDTKGHSDDHVALWCGEERALFTGDCVLGYGSSVFASYTPFMLSLHHLHSIAISLSTVKQDLKIFPAHGPAITEAGAAVGYLEKYIAHRTAREQQVFAAVKSLALPPPPRPMTMTMRTMTMAAAAAGAGQQVISAVKNLATLPSSLTAGKAAAKAAPADEKKDDDEKPEGKSPEKMQQKQRDADDESSSSSCSKSPDGALLSSIVDVVYPDVDPQLRVGAASNALHCLKKLVLDGQVVVDGADRNPALLDPQHDYFNDVHLARASARKAGKEEGCGSTACSAEAQNAVLNKVADWRWRPAPLKK